MVRTAMSVGVALSVVAITFGGCGMEVDLPDYEPLARYPEASLREHTGIVLTESSTTVDTGTGPCAAKSIDGFQPKWVPPMGPYRNICTEQDIDKAISCLFDQPPPGDCSAFMHAPNKFGCVTCLFTQKTLTRTGAWLQDSDTTIKINFAGCLALMLGDQSDTGCPARASAADQCHTYACYACTHQDAGITERDLHDCDSAASVVCNDYDVLAACRADALNGRAHICGGTIDTVGDLRRYADLFCGAPPTDASITDATAETSD